MTSTNLQESGWSLENDGIRITGSLPGGGVESVHIDGRVVLPGLRISEILGDPFADSTLSWTPCGTTGTVSQLSPALDPFITEQPRHPSAGECKEAGGLFAEGRALGWDPLVPLWHEDLHFEAVQGAIHVRKDLSLSDGILCCDYRFTSLEPILVRPAFGLSVALPLDREIEWTAPAPNGLRIDRAQPIAERRYLRPVEPWVRFSTPQGNVTLRFPDDTLDAVEARYISETGAFSFTPFIYQIGLNPGMEAWMSLRIGFADAGIEPETGSESLDRGYGAPTPERLARAEAAVRGRTSTATPGALAVDRRRVALERARHLETGKHARLEAVDRLARGEIDLAAAIDAIRATG